MRRLTKEIVMSDVNKQLLDALKMVLDDPDSLDGRPRTYECVVEAIAAAEQAQQSKTVTLEQLVANLKAGEGGDAISAAMDQACADMELGRRMLEQAQQSEPRCACGDSFTSDAVCANCLTAQQQAEPVAWEVRNGVATHDFYRSEAEAEEVARDMQKSHDLSGSLAAFNVRPVYAHPLAVAVPDGYALVPIEPTEKMFIDGMEADCLGRPSIDDETHVRGIWSAMIAAAQKGGK